MASTDKMVRSEVRKLARQGRLIDEAFKMFQRQVFPNAGPDLVGQMRICFFAGAAEVWAVMQAAMDDGDAISPDEEAFMSGWVDEVERFYERVIAASKAGTKDRPS